MILYSTLAAGALVTLLAHAASLALSPYTGLTGTGLALGQALLAIGIWGLRDTVGTDRLGRAAVVLVCFGYAAFATVALLALAEGLTSDALIALTPFYLMAVLFVVLGLAALALYAARREEAFAARAGLAPLLGLAALLFLLRPFLAGAAPIHAAAGIAGALALGWIAYDRLKP